MVYNEMFYDRPIDSNQYLSITEFPVHFLVQIN